MESSHNGQRTLPSLRRCWPMLTVAAREAVMREPHGLQDSRVRDEIARTTGWRVDRRTGLSQGDIAFVDAQCRSPEAAGAAASRGEEGVILDPVCDGAWRLSDCRRDDCEPASVVGYVEKRERAYEVVWVRGGSRRTIRYETLQDAVAQALRIIASETSGGGSRPVPIPSMRPRRGSAVSGRRGPRRV